jgi:nitroimidazol reductase NimA-like FMN-containing flavoprotein (pyridoxamine 5'-phosphate oxidase superfamily)
MSAIAPLFPLPPSPQNLPLFRALGPSQTEALLARNSSGTIAFTLGGRVQMLPTNYLYVNGWIYGRTADAAYLPRNAPVAFEVEERNNSSGWRSVLVQGQLDMVESDNPAKASGGWGRIFSALRRFLAPPGDEEPSVFFRDQIFCIRAAQISGRASLPDKTMSCAS